MAITDRVTFVSAVNSREILNRNLLISPVLRPPHPHQIIIQEKFVSAAKAYNDAIDRSENDLIVFAHQDMIFPARWMEELRRSMDSLERSTSNWGVLGAYGETQDRQDKGYIYSPDMGFIGKLFSHPEPVQTLDEIVLILRKSSGLRFDETLPHFHFYGADICLTAAKRQMTCYAIPAFCIHNTQYNLTLPKEFYECYKHIKRTRREFLPIQTSCITMSRFDAHLYLRRFNEFYRTYVLRTKPKVTRVSNGEELLLSLESSSS